MNKYNPHIHHRRSIRLKGYDYAQAGLYFITICVQNRECLFGEIENGEMILNEYGMIAYNEWMKTPEIRPNVELGACIIMPNHIHGIIHINGRGELHSPEMGNTELAMGNNNNKGECNSPQRLPSDSSLDSSSDSPRISSSDSPRISSSDSSSDSPLRSPSQTIGAIVRGYKSSVTKQLGLMGFNGKLWQRNYYEHIIRDEKSYNTISNYILNNPLKWSEDKFYG